MTFTNEPQSSDEFPVGMKFTREEMKDPYKIEDKCDCPDVSIYSHYRTCKYSPYNSDEDFDTRRDNEGIQNE